MLLSEQDDQDILKDAIAQTEDLFMVCVVGEFNAGKSKFINALLGDRWVEQQVDRLCVWGIPINNLPACPVWKQVPQGGCDADHGSDLLHQARQSQVTEDQVRRPAGQAHRRGMRRRFIRAWQSVPLWSLGLSRVYVPLWVGLQVEDLYLPVDLLQNLVIVDTPGTNAVIKRCAQLADGGLWIRR